jgi:homoserine O-acetyltransferase/O-succinyltransferase
LVIIVLYVQTITNYHFQKITMATTPATIYRSEQPFLLESGKELPRLDIAYHTYGTRASDDSNIIWVCHALTANSDVLDWWEGLFGQGQVFDPEKYFIVCANNLGSCYGTTGPATIDPVRGVPYYHQFPLVTIRDMVNAHERLREHLGIKKIHTLIGGSQGGQQALEWAIQQPELIERLALIATNAVHSPWGVAFNESQRMAIAADPTWTESTAQAGLEGMKVARSIALLSYRGYHTYHEGQQPASAEQVDDFPAASYQRYQGDKLAKRFNAFSYWSLSKTMDSHNIGRGRGPIEEVLATVKAHTLVVSVTSDILFPPSEQEQLAKHIPNAALRYIDSYYGHDGFLTETRSLSKIFEEFYATAVAHAA